jgi:hypothetical protein
LKGIPESLTPVLPQMDRIEPSGGLATEDSKTKARKKAAGGVSRLLSSAISLIGRVFPGTEMEKGNERRHPPITCKAEDSSVQELISLLDFRADVILAMIERETREALGYIVKSSRYSTHDEPIRDMKKQHGSKSQLDKYATEFAELHERNKQALIDGNFILSHEITNQIQYVLFQMERLSIAKSAVGRAYLVHPLSRLPAPWTFASDYPGLLPESLIGGSVQVVQMWKQDEQARQKTGERDRLDCRISMSNYDEKELWETAEDAMECRKAEKILKDLRKLAIRRQHIKESDRCPKCGDLSTWDGICCHHCYYSSG